MDSLLLKFFLMHLAILVGVLFIIIATVYFFSPTTLVTLGIWCLFQKHGLTEKYVEHQGYRFCYFFRGKPGWKPSILLLHGFSLRKESWLSSIKYFPKDTHLICVDLPGHGKTSCLPGDTYTALDQAGRLRQFVECIGLNRQPFHLVGISMGGMIAGVYAARYSSDLCALSLLCPFGLRYPVENEFTKQIMELEKNHKLTTENPLIPLNRNEADKLLKLSSYALPGVPKQLVTAILKRREPETFFFVKCFSDLISTENRYILHDYINKINTPTLVLWGKNDNIIDQSGARILASAIPDIQVHVLEKCGHLITIDVPRKAIELILNFHTSAFIKMNKKLV